MNGARGLVIAVLASLIVGGSVGMVGGILFARFALMPSHPPGAWRDGGPAHLMPRAALLPMLERRLDLTPEQRTRIERILDSSRVAFAAAHESTRAAVARELTPQQREEWKQLETRLMRERRGRGPRPPWRMDRP